MLMFFQMNIKKLININIKHIKPFLLHMVSKYNTATNSYHIMFISLLRFHKNPNFSVASGVKLSMDTGGKNYSLVPV